MTESGLTGVLPVGEFDLIERAITDLAAGRAIVIVDGRGQGELVFAATLATTALVRLATRCSTGMVGVAMPASACARLGLVPIRAVNRGAEAAEVMVPVDARGGTGSGFAAERARTIRVLADPTTGAADLAHPGSVLAFRAHDAGVLARPCHVEAALDLVRLASVGDAAVLCGVAEDDDGGCPHLREFADRHGLALVAVDELIAYRRREEPLVRPAARARMPLPQGVFTMIGYANDITGREIVALVYGDVSGQPALVRVHHECPLGDTFGAECDCQELLHRHLDAVSAAGTGVLIYLRRDGNGLDCARANADNLEDRRDVADVLADIGVEPLRSQHPHTKVGAPPKTPVALTTVRQGQ